MRKIYIAIVFLTTLTTTAQEIKWISFEEMFEAQKKEPRKVIIDAYTHWCGWCKKMDKETFTNKEVVEYINKNYYAIKFNAEGNKYINFKGHKFTNPGFKLEREYGRNTAHQLATYLRINSFPTIVYLDENANLIAPIPGYKDVNGIEFFLKLFATNKYKEITDQAAYNEYVKSFKHEFKK